MTSWVLSGTGSPLTASIESLVITWLKAHWGDGPTVTPALSSIRVTDQWWNDQGMYQISVRPMTTVTTDKAVGGQMRIYMTAVAIHVFGRRTSEFSSNPNVQNMLNEIDRIINLYSTTIASGILYCDFDVWRDIPDDTAMPDFQHKMITLKVTYAKAAV
jgi:hypothetical protein